MTAKKILSFSLISILALNSFFIKAKAEVSSNYTVSSLKTGEKEVGSLQHAILNAIDGDTIILSNGVYNVTDPIKQGSFFVIKQNNVTIKAKETNSTVIITGSSSRNDNYDGADGTDVSYQDTILVLGNKVTIEGLTITPLLDTTQSQDPLRIKNSLKVSDYKVTRLSTEITEFEMKNCKIMSYEPYLDYGGKVFLDINKSKDSSKILLTNNIFDKSVVELHTPATLSKNTFTGETKENASLLVKKQTVENEYSISLSDNKFESISPTKKAIEITTPAKVSLVDNKINNTIVSPQSNSFIDNSKNARVTYSNTMANVNFVTNGGTDIQIKQVEIGSKVEIPVITRDGFTFKNWCTDSGLTTIFDASTLINSDITLYAKWEQNPKNYTVTFHTNEGSNINSQSVVSGNTVSEPVKPTKSGYDFSGWYLDSSLIKPFVFTMTVTEDTNLYAKWDTVVPNVTVTFNTNGGSAISDKTIKQGEVISVPSLPTKTGYAFSNWYTDTTFLNPYNFNEKVNNNITLYAKWDEVINNVTVTFNSNGGTEVPAKTLKSGESITAPTKPTKTGYTFINWYTDTGLLYLHDFNNKVTSNITLYAKWESVPVNDVTVTFNSNGGTNVLSKTVKYNETITAPSIPVKTGYTFVNWYTDAGLLYPYNFNNKVTSNMTLYAKWESVASNDVTVIFNSNGGTSVISKTVKYNDTITTPYAPTKTGYTFVNWYTDAGLLYLYNFNARVTSNMTLYAKWQTVGNITVTFNSNGGSNVSSKTVKYNETVSEPSYPTKTGYSFDGWYTDSNLNYKYNFNTSVVSNITLYARWSVLSNYNIVSFVTNGGTSKDNITVKDGQSISQPSNPSRTGYIFDGWYKNSSLTDKYNFSNTVTQNLTLYAKWISEKDVLLVDFKSNGGSSVASIKVNYSNKITQPTNPKRDSYTFEGWYTNESLTNKFSFSTQIKQDITLYAKWVSSSYTVTFDSRGGTYIAPKYVSYNEKVASPNIPSFSGYRFLGWYKDSAGINKFDFAQSITSDITIYAKWEIVPQSTPIPPTTNPQPTISYTDVPSTHWAYDAISSLTRRGILEGQSVSKFVPEKQLTRAEFASILAKAFDLTEKTDAKNYKDVTSNDWFNNYVKIVTSNNIYSGYDDGTFKPNKSINREEMSVVIYRVLNMKGFSINKMRDDNVTDLYNATFGKEAITYLYQRGIVNGDNKKYMPTKNSTRAEASMVIYNLINLLEK